MMNAPLVRASNWLVCIAALLGGGAAVAGTPAPALPDPCKLITVAEMEKITGPLSEAPSSPDPGSGQISCSYTPAKGPRFVELSLHEGDLAVVRKGAGFEKATPLPEFGKDAFVSANASDYADLYAKKGKLVLEVSLPSAPGAVEIAKAVARKALPRL